MRENLLSEWVAVMNGKINLTTLAAADYQYATPGEINKKVVGTFDFVILIGLLCLLAIPYLPKK